MRMTLLALSLSMLCAKLMVADGSIPPIGMDGAPMASAYMIADIMLGQRSI